MNKNGHWLVVVAATLFVVPSLYLMGELTDSPPPGRERGAGAAGKSAREGEGSALGSADAGAASARRRSTASSDVASGPGSRGSRGVYGFSRTVGSSRDGAPVVAASYGNRDPNFGRLSGQFFDPRDLAVLDEIIRANGLNEDSSASDYDDGDGVLEPTELGNQIWCGSRLRVLQMGPTSFATFGYTVRELPSSLANLEYLVVLESNMTGLESLPQTLGQLQDLERVSAVGNRLKAIPSQLASAERLEEIQLGNNQISKIPTELERKSGLKGLFVEGNPIQEMPRMLVKQNEKLMQGKLAVPMRDFESFGPDCRVL